MFLIVEDLLTLEEIHACQQQIAQAEFIDGKQTAGWHAQMVKQNSQLPLSSPQRKQIINLIQTALDRHPLVQAALLPRLFHSFLVSRYSSGMAYGRHTDNAFMGSEKRRSDISFTIFLQDGDRYNGGELVIEHFQEEKTVKLDGGAAVFYPASTLHWVNPVISGERLVVVGWCQSLIRDPQQRELLFDLDTVRRSLFQKEGKSDEFDLLCKTYTNLLRQWGDG